MAQIMLLVVVASILPPNINLDDFSSLSSEDLDSLQLNAQVTYLLFSTLRKEMQKIILEEEDICEDAHLIWEIPEEMYVEPQSDDHAREANMSPEECSSSSPTCCEPQVTFKKKQDGQSSNDPVSLQKPVRPVYQAGQTGSSRGTTYECSNGTSQESSKASTLITSSCSRSENEIKMLKINKKLNEVLNDEPEKITSEHMVLQTTHKELESSHEKVVESYAALDIAHEVVMTSVKLYQPPSHICTCSHVEIILSCVGHVVVESCDDLIAQENDELKREVEKLQLELTKLKSKVQVQPSQDNRGIMVKKLKKGSNITTSAPQKGQVKKRKIQAKEECLVQLKGSNIGHNSYICPMEIKNKTKLTRGQKYISKTRTCFSSKKIGHMIATCPIQQNRSHSYKNKQESKSMMKPVVKQVQDAKVNDETRRVKHHTCYTCREKGRFGKDCPKGNLNKSNLVHYNFAKIGKDNAGACAVRVIDSPRTSIRVIWIPKHLVTNLDGPNKIWVPKGSY
ncbi:hypothetical protein GQ55_3G378300 [Panicum hallii var. hallii]|uniref:CCHC-type domain-containing protein n=1 Tax=Panicum hallii var. hallii TaxID=1504633 RepID=A0A2T7EGB1_9POAL|nr:hypothetical protein GQ55_3G378300 [Panicum hallii var. hallii]